MFSLKNFIGEQLLSSQKKNSQVSISPDRFINLCFAKIYLCQRLKIIGEGIVESLKRIVDLLGQR